MTLDELAGDVDVPGVPIADVARTLGVPMPTLRSWERRYNMPPGVHAPGKHRRYTPADLHALRLMRDQVARGKRASVAACDVQQLVAPAGRSGDFVAAILLASERSDPRAVRDLLVEAHAALGLAACLDDVLLPALQQVGRWWAAGRCDVDQEHLTTEASRAWLESLESCAPKHRHPIVLACGPTDLHTIGLEALAALLRHDGRACRMLGARTQVAELLAAILAGDAVAVVIVSHLNTGRRRAIESIRASSATGTTTFYAGNAFTTSRSRAGLPGTYLGTCLETACRTIDASLAGRAT